MEAIMYHYVRPETTQPPAGYYHLPLDQFRRQLDYLADEYTLLSKSTFSEILRGTQSPPDDALVLTFDDGLADHYRWVKPELERRDLWGIFFVQTAPLVRDRSPIVHRVHTLVSLYPADQLLTELREILAGVDGWSPAQGDDIYAGRDTAEPVRTVKRLLNQAVPYGLVCEILDELETRFPKAGAVTPGEFYLSRDQLRGLADAGMVVGAHSVSHPILSRLDPRAQRAEIQASKRHLETIVGEAPTLFAYPYGGETTYTSQTIDTVRAAGFEAGFTTVSGSITDQDVRDSPYTLRRRDCTAFEHGESSASLSDS